MEKENSDKQNILKEIEDLKRKIHEMKVDYTENIHTFLKCKRFYHLLLANAEFSIKQQSSLKKLNFYINKTLTPSLSSKAKLSKENVSLADFHFTNFLWAGEGNAYSNQIVASTNKGFAYVFNSDTKACVNEFYLGAGALMTCAMEQSENGMIAVGGFDGAIHLKNINTTSDRKEDEGGSKKFTGHQGVVSAVRFLNTIFMISASFDSVLLLWDINSQGKYVSSYHEHSSEVSGLDVNDINANIFATGSGDTTVKLWDIREKKACVASFQGSDSSINCVKFLPGRLSTLAAGSEDSLIRLYDLRALNELGVYRKQNDNNSINSIGFSKSGQVLFASSNESQKIHFWDIFGDGSTFREYSHPSVNYFINILISKITEDVTGHKGITRAAINSAGDTIGYIIHDNIVLIK